VPAGPQGKIIAGISTSGTEKLRTRLRDHRLFPLFGRIAYQAFANAVQGRGSCIRSIARFCTTAMSASGPSRRSRD
jgi:hypothetical protein